MALHSRETWDELCSSDSASEGYNHVQIPSPKPSSRYPLLALLKLHLGYRRCSDWLSSTCFLSRSQSVRIAIRENRCNPHLSYTRREKSRHNTLEPHRQPAAFIAPDDG